MKKKLLSLALACGMVFSLAACGTPANNESPAPTTESVSYTHLTLPTT